MGNCRGASLMLVNADILFRVLSSAIHLSSKCRAIFAHLFSEEIIDEDWNDEKL